MSLQDRSAGRTFAIGGNIQFLRFRCYVSPICKYRQRSRGPLVTGPFCRRGPLAGPLRPPAAP
jgi:hypothetical protein